MRRLILSVLVLILLLVPSLAYAEVNIIDPDFCNNNETKNSSVCQSTKKDPLTGSNGTLLTIANILAWLGGVIAVVMIIYAGFVYVTSSGDDGKIKSAKNIILYSIVGLVVIVVSRIIVAFVIDRTLR